MRIGVETRDRKMGMKISDEMTTNVMIEGVEVEMMMEMMMEVMVMVTEVVR